MSEISKAEESQVSTGCPRPLAKVSFSTSGFPESSSKFSSSSTSGYKLPYMRCLDVERQRAQLQNIKTRIWQNHVAKACGIIEHADKKEKKRQQKLKKEKGSEKETKLGEGEWVFESEVFDESDSESHETAQPWRLQGPRKKKKTRSDKSLAARKLGLAKCEEFTGTEAHALKKLLRTLRTKTWDPQLYFHIRFFSVRNELHPTSAEKKALAKSRWHFILRMLKVMAHIEQVLAERSYHKTLDCCTYLDMVEEGIQPILWGRDRSLPFDKHAYKVHANVMPSLDAIETLRDKLPEDRSREEVAQAVLSLQYVTAFAKLPSTIQFHLVEYGYYLSVGSKRVIVRQGHKPQNYYFVLLGQAFSKRFLYPSGKTETTAVYRKGDGFGSVAMLKECDRLTTVVSQTPLHLLVVPKEVFLTHFGTDVENPVSETIKFLSKIWFMQSWPISYLIKCPHQCREKQFRRTEIVENNAARSKWIYVVKKGECKVFLRTKEHVKTNRNQGIRSRSMSIQESPSQVTRQLRSAPSSMPTLSYLLSEDPSCHYKLLQTLRYLDIFGLEDICLDPRNPPQYRPLLMISDDVEFVMLSKTFYLRLASLKLRRKVVDRLRARKLTYAQVTATDCCLIKKGGIKRDPKTVLDPIDPAFCIHCM